ncbi:MAG: FG-GAP-like repeat-containing protein [Candidatus Latescibacterota bacterium]|nr:FG-GAP-like repeat-containing protein [Candidatus Latescibacterota bacterium]
MSLAVLAFGCESAPEATGGSKEGQSEPGPSSQFLWQTAQTHQHSGRRAEAIQALQQLLQLDENDARARMQLARMYKEGGDDDLALSTLGPLLQQQPHQAEARLLKADLLMTRAPPDPAGALAEYVALLQADPSNRRARSGAAASRLRLGDFTAAAAEMADLLREDPSDPHIAFLLGTAYHWLRDYGKAITAYRAAIDVLPITSSLRPVRQWNLRLAHIAAHDHYPGNLPASQQIHPAPQDAQSPVKFADVAAQAGVDKHDRGRGSAWGDFDGDGDLDLFSVGIQVVSSLYLNQGRSRDGQVHFTDVAQQSGIADPRGGWSSTTTDFDNDGDLDLYVTRDAWEGGVANSLFVNGGSGRFEDEALRLGVEDPDASFTAAWADYDGDGLVDLYVADGITGDGAPNKLFRNTGSGFEDQAASAGVDHRGKSLGVTFGDVDRDGDVDLYVADVGGPNTLYRNEGATRVGELVRFRDVTDEAGVAAPEDGGYVAFFFDSDQDGWPDLFASAMCYYEHFIESQVTGQAAGPSRPHLYRNRGDGTFQDVAVRAGISRSFGSMGAGHGDIDYDGLVDIYLSNGGPIMPRFEPNTLYHNLGERFADITESAGVGNPGKGHGATFADYDEDGDLDLYAGVGGHYPGDLWANSLYRNDGHNRQWLGVRLWGAASNRSAIGARVRIRVEDRWSHAEVASGGGFGSTNSLVLEFGLGNADRVDEVEVQWPAGSVSRRRNLKGGKVYEISEEVENDAR